jgi:glutamate formiminotransferase/formiminotetrahydrofolate cyclodeaminase
MSQVVECVPNFSEGRSEAAIEAIAEAIRRTDGCHLLDVDPGPSTNRTVYTFVGSPQAVVEGAMNATRTAKQWINMAKHKGAHPRIGALDVCPFVPVSGITPQECVEQCAHVFSQRASSEFNIPIYLYQEAASEPKREELASIRAGEYEGLPEKIKQPEWKPDYGPAEFVPCWGASVVGVRKFLIAYNVNLLGTKEQAHRIALNVRTAGRGPKEPGRLACCKALGWYLEEQDMAQISINLTDFETTPVHVAFEECSKDAKNLNVAVVGSEIVGLVPLKALLMAADYYVEKENLFIVDEHQKIRLAVERLGLNSVSNFDPNKKIIEYVIGQNKDGPLLGGSVRHFVENLAARSSAPGGGAASAAIAAMGAGLGSMVGWMTYGNKKYAVLEPTVRQAILPLHTAVQELLPLVDADATAFTDYMTAKKLPNSTEEEKKKREAAIENGLKTAIQVPLSVIRIANGCWQALLLVARCGNYSCKSDVEVYVKPMPVL